MTLLTPSHSWPLLTLGLLGTIGPFSLLAPSNTLSLLTLGPFSLLASCQDVYDVIVLYGLSVIVLYGVCLIVS